MLDLQTISDRIEIQDLLTAYACVIDRRDWGKYPSLFTDDAFIDYRAAGGLAGGVLQMVEFLKDALSASSASQHLMSNFEVDLHEGTANVRCMLHNPMIWGHGEDLQTMLFGLWYVLELQRSDDGWRIAKLEQELSYSTGSLP